MSMAPPSLHCPCNAAFREAAFAYDAPPEGETRFDMRGQIYRRRYDSCRVCGHWFAVHTMDLASLYDRAYVDATYGGAGGLSRRFGQIMELPPERSDNRQRVARLLAFAGRNRLGAGPGSGQPRLLDIGAGIGVFAAVMKQSGWLVVGIERDPRSLEHLRNNVGIVASGEDVFSVTAQSFGAFDFVTLIKVLEHVEDPIAMLKHAGGLLQPGGHVYIEVPDVAAAKDGPGREEFFIEHHHVFSAQSLASMVGRAGASVCELESLREPSGKYTLRAFCLFS